MPHVINSRALTDEKPCITCNKAIYALLMHGYATFNMIVPGPQICCRYEMCTARPSTRLIRVNRVRATSVKRQNKILQEKNAKCSQWFQFLCNNSYQTWFFNALTFARSLGRCWKLRPSVSVFNTSHGTWRVLNEVLLEMGRRPSNFTWTLSLESRGMMGVVRLFKENGHIFKDNNHSTKMFAYLLIVAYS